MNFKGHLVGGLIASSIASGASAIILKESSNVLSDPAVIFCVCLFMSLFPDFDTASIPQKYFYRSMLLVVPYVYWYYSSDVLFVLAMFLVLPLVHKHRGWTHWKKTPFIIAFFVLWVFDRNKGVYKISVNDLIIEYLVFTLCLVLGHYTHLLLDSKTIKVFNNSSDHH